MFGKYDGASALILGLGMSGEAAALLVLARGGRVLLIDEGDEAKMAESAARVRQAGGRVAFNVVE